MEPTHAFPCSTCKKGQLTQHMDFSCVCVFLTFEFLAMFSGNHFCKLLNFDAPVCRKDCMLKLGVKTRMDYSLLQNACDWCEPLHPKQCADSHLDNIRFLFQMGCRNL